ncbi:hypothetical protein TNCV_2894391 [Trichonephila clavipes]|nr:hypothetical protein TNCV_2894391 [Trichonephila clavipes]
MASLGHQSLHPTDLGRVDEEMASTGGEPSQGYKPCLVGIIRKNSYKVCNVEWDEKGQCEVRNTFIRRKVYLQLEQRIIAHLRQKCNYK